MIHRIDLAYEAASPTPDLRPPAADLDDPRRRCCSSRTLVVLRDHRRAAARSPTPAASPRSCCCCCRWCPGIGTTINGARIWIHARPVQLPARRGRQGAAGDRVRRLPRAAPRRAGAGRPPGRCASTCPAAATSARSWRCGWSASASWSSSTTSAPALLFFGLFLVMLYVATERPGWLVVGGAAVRRPAPTSAYLALRPRAGPRRRLAATRSTTTTTTDGSCQIVEAHVRHGAGAA